MVVCTENALRNLWNYGAQDDRKRGKPVEAEAGRNG